VIDLDQIPPIRGPRPAGRPPVSRKAPREPSRGLAAALSRRTVLRTMIASGTFLGFSILGAFPAARRAYSDGYDIKGLPCPSYAGPHNCSPGCGPSVVEFASCGSDGWHKNGVQTPGILSYTLLPNNCYGGWADGWMWRYDGTCLGCLSIDFRCHDGRTISCTTGRGGSCTSHISICRWITRCVSF
jgi:hypothetical protein